MVCILAPINPKQLSDLLYDNLTMLNINPSSSSISNLVRGLVDMKTNVLVITLNNTSSQSYCLTGKYLKIIAIGCRTKILPLNIFPPLKHLSKLIIEQVNKEIDKITIIHAHWCYEYALAAKHFKKICPIVCTVRDFAPIIHKSINMLGSIYSFFAKFYWLYKLNIFKKIISDRKIIFIANSEYTANQLIHYDHDMHPNIIYNSVEETLILDKIEPLDNRNNIISIAMSLDDDRKNIVKLLEAWSIYIKNNNDKKLILIGNYHKNSGVHLLSQKLGITSSVIFLGKLSRPKIRN